MAGNKVNNTGNNQKTGKTSSDRQYSNNLIKLEQLLAAAPDLYLILTPDLIIETATYAFLKVILSKPDELFGKYILDVFANKPAILEGQALKSLQSSLQQVITTKKPQHLYRQSIQIRSNQNPGRETSPKFFNILNTPVLNEAGAVEHLILRIEVISDYQQPAPALSNLESTNTKQPERAQQERTTDIEEEHRRMKEAQVIGNIGSFEWNLGDEVVNWSDEMYRINGLEPQSEVITIAKINNLLHPDDIARLETLKEQAIIRPGLYQLVHRIVNPDGTVKHVRQRFESLVGEKGSIIRIHGSLQDITSQVEVQERLEKSEALLHSVEALAQTGSYEGDLDTMTFRFTDGMFRLFGEEPHSFTPTLDFIDSRSHPEDVAAVRKVIDQAVIDKKPYVYTRRIQRKDGEWRQVESHGKIICNPEGNAIRIIGLVQDVTERNKAEQKFKESNELLQSVLDTSLVCFSVLEAVRNENGRIQDFKIKLVNKALEQQTQRSDLVGRLYAEEYPGIVKAGLFECMLQVMETGKTKQIEYFYLHEGFNHWFSSTFVKADDGLVASNLDITARKLAELKVQEQTHFIQRITQTVPDMISVMEAESRKIIFRNTDVFDLHGYNPAILESLDAAEKAKLIHPEDLPVLQQYFKDFHTISDEEIITADYRSINFLKSWQWFHARGKVFQRDENGKVTQILNIVQDITERKKDEQAIKQNLALLQQSEDVARMGSWEYNIITSEFRWSRGMYRLFGLPESKPVSPETYLEYVIKEDEPIAKKIIKRIREGRDPIDEILRLRVDSQELTLKVKGLNLPDDKGEPLKMLGIDLNISEVKRLEEENLQLRLQKQKDLLLAILEAQEEERRRISESLHNGVGQLLYAAQLSMETLHLSKNRGLLKQVEETLEKTENLIKEAIRETRQVSHELVPLLLQQFGLEKAILDFCERFSYTGIKLNCHGFEARLDKHLELAIYRISQELVNNIAKHSKATQARLEMFWEGELIIIEAQDNGKGLNPNSLARKGIGLKTIQDRVALLGGNMEIESTPGKGTLVTITIPLKGSFLYENK